MADRIALVMAFRDGDAIAGALNLIGRRRPVRPPVGRAGGGPLPPFRALLLSGHRVRDLARPVPRRGRRARPAQDRPRLPALPGLFRPLHRRPGPARARWPAIWRANGRRGGRDRRHDRRAVAVPIRLIAKRRRGASYPEIQISPGASMSRLLILLASAALAAPLAAAPASAQSVDRVADQRHHRSGAEPQRGDADRRLSDRPDRRADDQLAADAPGRALDPAAVPRLGPVQRPRRRVRVRPRLVDRPLQRPDDRAARRWTCAPSRSPGRPRTNGTISAGVIVAPMHQGADFDKWRGKLAGKIVMRHPPGHRLRADRGRLPPLDRRRARRAQHLSPAAAFARPPSSAS